MLVRRYPASSMHVSQRILLLPGCAAGLTQGDPFRHAKIRREVGGKAFIGRVEDIEIGSITRERCLTKRGLALLGRQGVVD